MRLEEVKVDNLASRRKYINWILRQELPNSMKANAMEALVLTVETATLSNISKKLE